MPLRNPILTGHPANGFIAELDGKIAMHIKSILYRIMADTRGATAIEYGLLVGMIAMAAVLGMDGFASEVEKMWHKVETGLQ
jgi:pilus assembly protein Flp/PilA